MYTWIVWVLALIAWSPVQDLEQDMNGARSDIGLAPLTRNITMDEVCHERIDYMLANGYHAHDNDQYVQLFINHQLFGYQLIGENVGYTNQEDSGNRIFRLFMASPSHRENILEPTFSQVGIWWALSEGLNYFCVVFAG